MVDVSASKKPKGTNTKKDKEDMIPKIAFFSKVRRISDTNIGIVNMIQLKDRLKEGQSSMVKKIYKSKIVHVVAFPPTLPCLELVMECASRFDIVTQSIIFYEGKRVLANISGQVVEEVFNIPQHRSMTMVTMDQGAKLFQGNQEAYFIHLKQNWLNEGKKRVTKLSKLTKSNFKPKYGDLIVLLSPIMGVAQGMQFKNWMYHFIDEIENGKRKFDWARIISENLELQLKTVQNQKQFYMESFLFYLIARLYENSGLKAIGVPGNGSGQCLVHECYPQLHLHNAKDYKMLYDAFAIKTVRILQRTPAKRLSLEAEAKVRKYGSWFIQFPQFTYIRVAGSAVCPKRLPRYPLDKVVLMELARQLEHYDKMMKLKGETWITFSFGIGNDTCPNPIAFAATEKELERYHLGWYRARQGF